MDEQEKQIEALARKMVEGARAGREPGVALALQPFPIRAVALVISFDDSGTVLQIPFTSEQARGLASGLIELADELDAGGTGSQN